MNIDKVKKILDDSNVSVSHEIDIIEYIDKLEQDRQFANCRVMENMLYRQTILKALDCLDKLYEDQQITRSTEEELSSILKESNIN